MRRLIYVFSVLKTFSASVGLVSVINSCRITCAVANYLFFGIEIFPPPFELETPPGFEANVFPKGKILYQVRSIHIHYSRFCVELLERSQHNSITRSLQITTLDDILDLAAELCLFLFF